MSTTPAPSSFADGLSAMASRVLPQDVDLAFGFEAKAAPGKFVVRGFTATEEIFDCYSATVDLISDDDALDLNALLDTEALLTILHAYDEPRHIHGTIASAEKHGHGIHRTLYRLTLKPALHRLDFFSDSKIYQAKSVPEISKQILTEHNVTDVDWRLEFEHLPREYCVMYGETGLEFIKRIWAEEGIFFWFEFSKTGHKMIVSDAPLAMPKLEHASQIVFNNLPGGTLKKFWVNRFDQIERVRATNRMARDYTFKQPQYNQQHAVAQYADNGAKGKYELYHYPGRHKEPKAGQPFNDYALEAHRVDATTAEGETNNIQLSAGFVFGLTEHRDERCNTNHRLLKVVHTGEQPAALEEEAPVDSATTYSASFVTQPANIPFRPINPSPKPVVEGPQIAHVTGPQGEEIYCDEHGRVKVWFPWDRHGQKNETSSCWVRVSQNWAGGTWGHIAVPRIGQEVIVDFLGGDPDQPIITGRTYHAANRSPYPLPEHKTKMVIRSDTHKGAGFNEISFEDEAGTENIALHAQKDQTLKVLNNRMKRVDRDQVESVGSNKSIDIGKNHQESIGGSMNLSVGSGGIGLFGALAGLLGKAAQDALNVAGESGDPAVGKFLAGVAGLSMAGSATTAPMIAAFNGAGSNRQVAGADQSDKGTALGAALSSALPLSGVKNTMVEKFELDTVGMARSEQIGLFKNTMVGAVQNTFVGAKQFTKIGEEQRLQVGKIKTAEIGEEYTVHSGKRAAHSSGKLFQISSEEKFEGAANIWEIKTNDTLLLSAPGGYIEINKSGVKIRGKKVEIEGNAIDLRSGGPGEGSKCLRAMAASATPFVR